jgi:hypothetical protein
MDISWLWDDWQWDGLFLITFLAILGVWNYTATKNKRTGGFLSIGLGLILLVVVVLVVLPAQREFNAAMLTGIACFSIISGFRDTLPEHLNERYGKALFIGGLVLAFILVAIMI